jgi:hypothetical protein
MSDAHPQGEMLPVVFTPCVWRPQSKGERVDNLSCLGIHPVTASSDARTIWWQHETCKFARTIRLVNPL